jgi:hypothetical protein
LPSSRREIPQLRNPRILQGGYFRFQAYSLFCCRELGLHELLLARELALQELDFVGGRHGGNGGVIFEGRFLAASAAAVAAAATRAALAASRDRFKFSISFCLEVGHSPLKNSHLYEIAKY